MQTLRNEKNKLINNKLMNTDDHLVMARGEGTRID